MEIELVFSRKTKKNYYKRYFARDGVTYWYVFTNKGVVTRVLKRVHTDISYEKILKENWVDVRELPLAVTNFIKRST
jgi:hypothetical protein